jgi:hypothetical protein
MDWADTYIRDCFRLAAAGIEPPPQVRSQIIRAAQRGAWLGMRLPVAGHNSFSLVYSRPANLSFNLQISCWMLSPGMIL